MNYRKLNIQVTSDALVLNFGIFTWKEPFENIVNCALDDKLPNIKKNGGAGIHFFVFEKRYRVSFNFLEYARVVVAFKKARGLVKELSFSARQPDEVISEIQKTIYERNK